MHTFNAGAKSDGEVTGGTHLEEDVELNTERGCTSDSEVTIGKNVSIGTSCALPPNNGGGWIMVGTLTINF